MKRYWINQPSILQLDHKFHGMLVLAPKYIESETIQVWPNKGPIISMVVSSLSLSEGWPE